MNSKKTKFHAVRMPSRLDEMIYDIMNILETNEWTEALTHILIDWEKMRYVQEKKRLMELLQLKYSVITRHPKAEFITKDKSFK